MEETNQGKEAKKEETKEGTSKLNKIFMIALIVNIVLVLSSAFLIFYIKYFKSSPYLTDELVKDKVIKDIKAYPDFIEYKLEPFTVNLKQGKTDNFLNARFTLIATDYETKGEIDKKIDLIRDKVIEILNNKSAIELVSIQGKLFLKDQIVTQINTILNKGSVKEVYIESFVIQ